MDWLQVQEESLEDAEDSCYDEDSSSIDDSTSQNNVSSATLRSYYPDVNSPRIDSYRISMANLEDSQDVDLDAILGELCALERTCENDVSSSNLDDQRQRRPTNAKAHLAESTDISKNEGIRTDSPDNDSAFSDTVSMLSSESSASSSGSSHKLPKLNDNQIVQQHSLQFMDATSRAKAEKIRLALEKMREASVQKLFIKVFTIDGSGKSLLVDENMNVAHVCRLLADKNHVLMDPKWAVVEHLPDLLMERVYEDHELLVENLLLWTRDSKNKLLFMERPERTQLFTMPEKFLLGESDSDSGEYDDHSRNTLLEEFFLNSNAGLPEVEGPLYLKSDSKKGWKRYHFILRASGLYYWPKDKARTARDLVCLATFDVNQVYYAIGWKKKYKAPTDFCFAIKHPRLQQAKSTKYIKFLCAEEKSALNRWIVGIRIAKYGSKLIDNYRILVDELAQEDLDLLAQGRSCSVSSITDSSNQAQYSTVNDNACQFIRSSKLNGVERQTGTSPTKLCAPVLEQHQNYNNDGRLSRTSSSSSSGCLSDSAHSSCEVAFECGEFPNGTIKRKPSMNPKLPLTSITRQLKEVGETVNDDPKCSLPNFGSSTLTRHHSCRKSRSDSDSSGTQKKKDESDHSVLVSSRVPSSSIAECLNLSSCNQIQELDLTTGSVGVPMVDSIDSLPPSPPPLQQLNNDFNEAFSSPLPPPPLEIYQLSSSLDSLPPPPAPGELPMCNTSELHDSALSLTSILPPPPSPTTLPPPPLPSNPLVVAFDALHSSQGSSKEISSLQPKSNPNSPTSSYEPNCSCFIMSQPPSSIPTSLYSLQTGGQQYQYHRHSNNYQPLIQQQTTPIPANSIDTVRKSALKQSVGHYEVPSYFPGVKVSVSPQAQRHSIVHELIGSPRAAKKISFSLPAQYQHQQTQLLKYGSPVLPLRKPLPPQRANSTRLSSPKKLAASEQAPPGEFLKDLQRVMRKKWQVSQKCKLDITTTPHEVLGFRDPPPAMADYRETNVSNWVQEHYGLENLYENVYVPEKDSLTAPSIAVSKPSVSITDEVSHKLMASAIVNKRRPPPPPPKRAETTQLTTHLMH